MPKDLTVFGLPSTATESDLDAQVLRLIANLSKEFRSARASDQAKVAASVLRLAYEDRAATQQDRQSAFDDNQTFNSRLRIGQVCLASGMISLEQLEEAVKEQLRSDRQLGEILLDKQFISQEELDGLLIAQDLISPDEIVTDLLALQLMALGLVSPDLIMIALIEQRVSLYSVGDVLVRHGWIEQEIIEALT